MQPPEPAPAAQDAIEATVELRIAGHPVALPVSVPRGEVALEQVLSNFHRLADAVLDVGTAAVQREGRTISCRKGCGACCRQPVPVSFAEARALAALVAALPEPRRSAVRARFAEGRARLERAGVLARMTGADEPDLDTAGIDYFKAGVPCPFLEEESCSIHAQRPVACREYLVTSPAANCAAPTRDAIAAVPLPAHVGRALRALDRQHGARPPGWTLLVLALDEDPTPGACRIGPAWIEDGLALLGGSAIADWIRADSLGPFLAELAALAGFSLGAADCARLVAGAADTDSGADRWTTCALPGREPVHLRFARDRGAEAVRLWIEAPAGLHAPVRLLLRLCQRYRVSG